MRRTPLSGGCLIRRTVPRPIVQLVAKFPWIFSRRHYCRRGEQWSATAARDDHVDHSQLALEHVLEQLRAAQSIDRLSQHKEAVVSGRGKHLGVAVNWCLRWTAAGSFAEEIRGPQLSFKWGYDGRKDSGCWEVDSSGLVRVMECDDHEAVLMTTYIRTGCWLQPHLQDRFEMELLPLPMHVPENKSSNRSRSSRSRDGDVLQGSPAFREEGSCISISTRVAEVAPDAEPAGLQRSSDTACRKAVTIKHRSQEWKTSASASSLDEVVAIGLRVRGRRLRVRVLVRRRDWRLLGFDHRMCADIETWELGEWREWAEGVHYPTSAVHKAVHGGQHAYLTDSGAVEAVAPLSPLPCPRLDQDVCGGAAGGPLTPPIAPQSVPLPTDFGIPLQLPTPADTTYSLPSPGGQSVPLWRSASGHFLVRPSINGQEGGGYFVLDTGASGFVVTPQAAARLGGQSFGETHAAAISGKVAARFVRLGSWALGGVAIRQPVLMVMRLEGLVRGAPGEVVGIVGHDLFSRALLELPQLCGGPPVAARTYTVSSPLDGVSPSVTPLDMATDVRGPRLDSVPESASLDTAPWLAAISTANTSPPTNSWEEEEKEGGSAPSSAPCSTPVSSNGRSESAPKRSRDSGEGDAARQADNQAPFSQPLDVAAVEMPPPAVFNDYSTAAVAATTCARSSSSASSYGVNQSQGSGADRASGGSQGNVPLGHEECITMPSGQAVTGSDGCSSVSSSPSSSRSGGSCTNVGGGAFSTKVPSGRSATARAVHRAACTLPYTIHEIRLHHPFEYANDSQWVWEPLIMISNLPHVHLRLGDPCGGRTRSALLMVDSGACGADLMLHARAQRELGLESGPGPSDAHTGTAGASAGGRSESSKSHGHYLRGVGQDPSCFVQLQVLDLPWLEVAGVRIEQVRCMCAAVGGLDISIYSHGILCGDLLARLDWAIDYTHKRIGFRRGAVAPQKRLSRSTTSAPAAATGNPVR